MRIPPTLIWLVGVAFVLFQLFLQLSSGIIVGIIMKKMHLSAFMAGLLSSALYIVYTGMQIPVGTLFDKKSTKHLMTLNVLLCSTGCFIFAQSHDIYGLFAGRILIGIGSAFAFVGLAHLLRQYFPLKHFAFMIGLSETLGFCISVVGIVSLGMFIQQWGWRAFIIQLGMIGCVLTVCCWFFIPKEKQPVTSIHGHKSQLILILKNKTAWVNGCFVGLCFAIITVFGALWSTPFIQLKLACNLDEASFITAMFFLGTGLSCPLFGFLSAALKQRKPLMLFSTLSTTFWLIMVLYLPFQSAFIMSVCMFCIGLSCGSYMLSYSIANELAPIGALSTCTGFTNTLAIITAPILQPTVGFLLDTCSQSGTYTLQNYQTALIILPLCTLTASMLVCFLPEKKSIR